MSKSKAKPTKAKPSKAKPPSSSAVRAQPQGGPARELRRLGERYIEETMERFPSVGSAMGRHEFDGELEVPSEKLIHAQQKLLRTTLEAVEAIPENDLRGDDWLDRRALLAELRTETWSYERETFRRNPESWVSGALGSVHHLVVRNADDLTPVAEAIASRLAKLPEYLEGAADLLKSPVPLWRETAQSSVAGAPALSTPSTSRSPRPEKSSQNAWNHCSRPRLQPSSNTASVYRGWRQVSRATSRSAARVSKP
jgi:hypothetical protein